MTTDQQAPNSDRATREVRRVLIVTWSAVAAALLGAVCVMVAVIALTFNHTLSLILACIGIPLFLIGWAVLAWLNRRR